MDDEKNQLAICIGTFDASGFPVSTQKYLGNYVQAAFQAICLNMLVSRTLGLGTTQVICVNGKDGESIRIEHHAQGFIAYLQQADVTSNLALKQQPQDVSPKTSESKTTV